MTEFDVVCDLSKARPTVLEMARVALVVAREAENG